MDQFLPTPHGDDFLLRPWQVEDAAWYVAARDEEIFKWTTENRALTVAETEEAIRRANGSPKLVCLAIVDAVSLDLLGNLALVLQDGERKQGEIMYWLAPAGRGRGIATKAVRLLCQWAFNSLGLERITLNTRPGNVRSQAVALRAGFRPLKELGEAQSGENHLWFELNPG